jgi:teichuronic acid biosynthesis glycosyltransferase TuaG
MNKQVYIVTPAYNNENFVNRTFSCLKNQTYTNWKWVVVDDGSEDATLQRLIEFSAMDNRVIVKKNLGNKGAGGAKFWFKVC